MRRILLILVPVVVLAGCSANQALVTGVDALANESGLLDQYDAYVDKDPDLQEESKEIRKNTSKKLRQLIEDAKEK